MQKEEQSKAWAVSIGMYPGVLFGIRSYKSEELVSHVLYLPFFDIALQIEK